MNELKQQEYNTMSAVIRMKNQHDGMPAIRTHVAVVKAGEAPVRDADTGDLRFPRAEEVTFKGNALHAEQVDAGGGLWHVHLLSGEHVPLGVVGDAPVTPEELRRMQEERIRQAGRTTDRRMPARLPAPRSSISMDKMFEQHERARKLIEGCHCR